MVGLKKVEEGDGQGRRRSDEEEEEGQPWEFGRWVGKGLEERAKWRVEFVTLNDFQPKIVSVFCVPSS